MAIMIKANEVKANVELLLRVRGLSKADLGALLGVHRTRVVAMLYHPTQAALERIAEALGVPVGWLSDPALAGKTVEELRGEGQ